jgi:hypothetical protein
MKLRVLLAKLPPVRDVVLAVLARIVAVGHPTNPSGNNRSQR